MSLHQSRSIYILIVTLIVVFDLSGKKTGDISFFPGKTADVTDDMESMGSGLFPLQKDDKLLDDFAADGKATCYSEADDSTVPHANNASHLMRLQQALTVDPTKFDHEAAGGLELEINGGVPPSKIHSPTHVAGLTQATGLVARQVFSPMASVTSQELRPTLMDLVMCSTYSNTMNPILNMEVTGLAGNNSGSILKSFQNEFDRLEKANMDSQLFCDVYHLVNLLVSFIEECVNNDVNVLTFFQNELDELVFDDKRGFQSANILHHLFATIDNPETLYSISDCLAFNLLNIKHEYERYVGRMKQKPFKFGHIIHFVVLMILHENRLFLQAQKNESLEAVVVNHELLEYYPAFQFYVLKVTSVILATRMCKQNPMGQSGN